MKTKTKHLFIAGMMGVLLTACTSETAMEEKTLGKGGSGSLKVEVVDGMTASATRADYSGFPATSFETGDAIGMYVFNGSRYILNNVRFVKQLDGSWEPDMVVPYNGNYTYYAYFPYSATAYAPSTSGTVEDIETKFAPFIGDANNRFWQANQSTKAGFTYSNLMIAKGSVTDADEESATVKFSMDHMRGLAVFTDDATEASFSGNIPYLIGGSLYFLMKPDVSTTFTDNTGTYSLNCSAGEYMPHSVKLATDLSMVDNAGTARESMTTANCYLVHAAGRYKLPLVYGNAIKDGAVNTTAFYPDVDGAVDTSTPRSTLGRFVNHNGDGITGPWITKNGTGVNAGMGLTAASAELLWQDAAGLISAVGIEGNYLTFSVGTFTGGNALIAVKNGSGTILWSWHIWATEDDLSHTTIISTGTYQACNYTVASVNLGWVPTGGEGKQGYCPYYQWGRKDPLAPCNGITNGNTLKTVYNISNDIISCFTQMSTTDATIADNIKNPTTEYYNTNTMGPVNTTYYNMWDARNKNSNVVTTATKKTVYDPCPPGFCVPTSNLWYYFGGKANLTSTNTRSDSNWDATNKGKTWTLDGANIYFPTIGYLYCYNGTLRDVGSQGYYWAATPNSTQRGRRLGFQNDRWAWNYSMRYYGCAVRPVAEE